MTTKLDEVKDATETAKDGPDKLPLRKMSAVPKPSEGEPSDHAEEKGQEISKHQKQMEER